MIGALLGVAAGALVVYEYFKHNHEVTEQPQTIRVPAAPISEQTLMIEGRPYAVQRFAGGLMLVTGQTPPVQVLGTVSGHAFRLVEARGSSPAILLAQHDIQAGGLL